MNIFVKKNPKMFWASRGNAPLDTLPTLDLHATPPNTLLDKWTSPQITLQF